METCFVTMTASWAVCAQPHAAFLILAGLALLIALEITLAFGIAKLVTGHPY